MRLDTEGRNDLPSLPTSKGQAFCEFFDKAAILLCCQQLIASFPHVPSQGVTIPIADNGKNILPGHS